MTEYHDMPIGKIVAENLSLAALFERYGLDYCCHGQQSLSEACGKHGLDLAQVSAEMAAVGASPRSGAPELRPLGIDELSRHIVAVHHTFTKRMLPSVAAHFATVVRVHGGHHPELAALEASFGALRDELSMHLLKEEEVLFPYLEALAAAVKNRGSRPEACFAEVSQPIAEMMKEHETAGAVLDQMHAETRGFQPPADACNTYRLLFKELADLEQDLHRHIALENYLLFPRAVELEKTLAGCQPPASNH
jgi:regulator of cell morphogenesis and NO signaling